MTTRRGLNGMPLPAGARTDGGLVSEVARSPLQRRTDAVTGGALRRDGTG